MNSELSVIVVETDPNRAALIVESLRGAGAFDVHVLDSGGDLARRIRALEPDVPLVVSAYCRGVPVGQQTLVTEVRDDGQNGSSPVVIPLADEVGGVIRLTVYDYRASPPKPIAERLVYRRSGRKLHVEVAGQAEKFSPGEIMSRHVEVSSSGQRPLVKVYTAERLRKMFAAFDDIRIYKRQLMAEELPHYLRAFPLDMTMRLMGWNLIVKAKKPL